jgi:acetolactate synthase-1/3 small subunit
MTAEAQKTEPGEEIHTFSLVTRDRPGVLVRIALVFSRRSYNIESLAVSPGATAGFARMTVRSRGAAENTEQIIKQLAKLIDVVFVTDHRGEDPVEAEIALVKLRCEGELRQRALAVAERYGARLSDDQAGRMIMTMQGESSVINAFLAELAPCKLEELVRSGKIVMDRGGSHFTHLLG